MHTKELHNLCEYDFSEIHVTRFFDNMMCGVCGSGKTTYAKKKEQEGYIRLSIDEEMWKLYGRKGIDYPEEEYEKLSEQVEAALQKNCCP